MIASDFQRIVSDCRKSRVCFSSPVSAVTSPTRLHYLPSVLRFFSKRQTVFDQIANVFVHIAKCICPNHEMYLFFIKYVCCPIPTLFHYLPSVSPFSVSHQFQIFLCFICPSLSVICFSFFSSRYHFLVVSNPFCSSCWQLQKSRTEAINIFNQGGCYSCSKFEKKITMTL